MDKPIFCGQEPSFMGGAFDSEEEYLSRTTQAQRLAGKPVNNNEDHFPIYFDGELEMMIGFDIVSFVDGIMPEVKYGDRIECFAIAPDDKKYDAVVHVGRYKSNKKLYCLIRLKSDYLLNVEYEGGSVEFKYKCEGWDVDANEDGQFLVPCEHEECRKKKEKTKQSKHIRQSIISCIGYRGEE